MSSPPRAAFGPSGGPTSSRLTLVAVLFVVLIGYAFITHHYAQRFGGNITGFACIGDHFFAPKFFGDEAVVLKDSDGYDGQFFLLLSHFPLPEPNRAKYLDRPAYRYQRIGYPWLARLAALGRPERLAGALAAVNLAAIVAGALFVCLMAVRQGASPWWGVVYALMSGLLIGLLRDLSEPAAMAFTLGGLYFYRGRRYPLSALFFAAGLMTRETVLMVLAPVMAHALFGERNRRGVTWLVISGLPAAAWHVFIYLRLGEWPAAGGGQNFAPPFKGLIASIGDTWLIRAGSAEQLFDFTFLIVFVLTLVLALRRIFQARDELSLAFVFLAVTAVFLSDKVWVEPWSYARVLLPLNVLLLLNYLKTKDRLFLVPLAGHAVLFGLVLKWQGLV